MKNFTIGLALILVWVIATGAPKKAHHEEFIELGADARAEYTEICNDCGATFTVHVFVTGPLEDLAVSLTYVEDRSRTRLERRRRGVTENVMPYSAEHP